jgi:hypothetical protein
MSRKCFVLMPFGPPFDEYYRDVLVPAITDAGFLVNRADTIYRPGRVMSDVFAEIESSDVLVADVTTKNPNVNYELGFAHALRRPVSLISQSIEDVPFDYRDQRVILYDTRSTKWAENLRSAITQSLKDARQHKPAHEERRRNVEVHRFYGKRPSTHAVRAYLDEIDEPGEINLLGIALICLADAEIQRCLEVQLRRGCRVRVLTLSPQSRFVKAAAASEQRQPRELKRDLMSHERSTRNLIENRLCNLNGHIELGHYDSPATYFILMTTKAMLVGPYVNGERGAFSPHIELRNADTDAYREFAAMYERLWKQRI